MTYRIFDLTFTTEEELDFSRGCIEVLREGFLTNHTQVKKFEESFSKKQKSSFAISVNNGTAALETAFRAIDIKNKHVFLPTNTFIATASAIINAGGIPHLVDIENEWFGICPLKLQESIKSIPSSNIGAIAAVHIGGHIAPSFLNVIALAKECNIPLIEDCAQAPFAKLDDIYAGSSGAMGCFSFFTTKTMTTGEGGMIVTNDPSLNDKAKQIRRFGMDLSDNTVHVINGSNFKMTEFCGLLGNIELKRVDGRISKRRALAKTYQENLDTTKFRCLGDPINGQSTHYKQIVVFKRSGDRKSLSDYLASHGIPLTGGVYNTPLHRQPSLSQYQSSLQAFPVSDFFSANHFCPPCYPELESQDVLNICEKINAWSFQ